MPESDIRTLGLLLIEGFPLMAYASIIEPFRAANALANAPRYRWTHVSVDGLPARASNGASIVADQSVEAPLACDTLFVIAGGDPAAFDDARTLHWLRRLGRSPVRIAGVSGAPFILARAGLLADHRVTVHWEHVFAFREAFPDIIVEQSLYIIDRRRMTCAGGTAGLDLAIELIERECGQALAARVGEWFIRTAPRQSDLSQRPSLRARYGVANDHVLKALAEMEAFVEEPLPAARIAAHAGVSVRQLERLFRAHLGQSTGEMYMAIRLDQALHLLRTTQLGMTQVAVACGFQNASHFSRRFKRRFGHPPSRTQA
ncbi:HTH-type transcriptional regulator CdhR [soil metagenome]